MPASWSCLLPLFNHRDKASGSLQYCGKLVVDLQLVACLTNAAARQVIHGYYCRSFPFCILCLVGLLLFAFVPNSLSCEQEWKPSQHCSRAGAGFVCVEVELGTCTHHCWLPPSYCTSEMGVFRAAIEYMQSWGRFCARIFGTSRLETPPSETKCVEFSAAQQSSNLQRNATGALPQSHNFWLKENPQVFGASTTSCK